MRKCSVTGSLYIMADSEICTNGDVEQIQPQSENDSEESMEVQTIQTICSSDSTFTVTPETHKEDPNIPYDHHKLFVGGLNSEKTNEQSLRDYFNKYGTITEITLKSSKGYAFIRFEEDDAVDTVIAQRPHSIDGKVIDSNKAIPHEVHQQLKHKTKKIFVGGVPTTLEAKPIKDYFQKFGEITEVALVTDKSEKRNRRGFCFVTFKSETSAAAACEENYHHLECCNCKVEVKPATPREPEYKKSHGGGPNNFGRGGGRGHPPYYTHGGRGGGMPHGFAPYGGHAAYYPFYPTAATGYPGNGGYMGGYGGFGGGYGGYTGPFEPHHYGGRRDDTSYNSRYGGPMRYAHHNHSHGHNGAFHPYSR